MAALMAVISSGVGPLRTAGSASLGSCAAACSAARRVCGRALLS